MDTAKAAAVAATHEGDAWDYIMGVKEVTGATLPIVAVPTTSGTGSHVTCFAVITNPKTNEKPGMGSPHIIPRLAVLDPELTNGAPRQLTLNTGFDVFAHALEAYTSQAASPMSDLFARTAIEYLAGALPRCLADGSDLEARGAMMLADTCAGAAICAAVVSAGHALAHVISGHFPEIAHGDALYAIYRPLLAFNATAMPEKHEWVAGRLKPGCTDIVAAFEDFFGAHSFVNALRNTAPDDATLDRLVDDVWRYLKFAVDLNPRAATQTDLRAMLSAALS
jgi:alcohol dehydrogenase class IV